MPTNLESRLRDFDRYIDATDDPRHKAMIRNFQQHNQYEQSGDLERLLALYTDDAEFHVYGAVFGPDRELHLAGKAALRERYERMFANYVSRSGDPEAVLEQLITSDWGIAGIFRSSFEVPGTVLAASGHEVADEAATYRHTQHLAFFRGHRDDLVCSMTYVTSQPQVERIG